MKSHKLPSAPGNSERWKGSPKGMVDSVVLMPAYPPSLDEPRPWAAGSSESWGCRVGAGLVRHLGGADCLHPCLGFSI